MNLRVRSVTGCSRSAMFAVCRSIRKSASGLSWVVDEVEIESRCRGGGRRKLQTLSAKCANEGPMTKRGGTILVFCAAEGYKP